MPNSDQSPNRPFNLLIEVLVLIFAFGLITLSLGHSPSFFLGAGLLALSGLWLPGTAEAKNDRRTLLRNGLRRLIIAGSVAGLVVAWRGPKRADYLLAGGWWAVCAVFDLFLLWCGIERVTRFFQSIGRVIARLQNAAADAVLMGLGLLIATRLWAPDYPPVSVLYYFWAAWVAIGFITAGFWRAHYIRTLAVRLLAFWGAVLIALPHFNVGLGRGFFAGLIYSLILFAVREGLFHRFRAKASADSERLRLTLALSLGFWVVEAMVYPVGHGSGDALWYATMMADMIEQVRHGIFPVFGGQSLYQFNGAIYPLRISPAFHYIGAVIDLITLQSLRAFAVQNLLIGTWAMLAGLISYLCLADLLPQRRWIANAVSFLFVACPGVMSIAYHTDLYMSWTTIPFVPLAFWAMFRAVERPDYRNLLCVGLALGLLWWGHAPIALWTSLFVIIALLISLVFHRERIMKPGPYLLGGMVAATIALFPIGAALFYPPDPSANVTGFQQATASSIVFFLRVAFPDVLLPLPRDSRTLGSFQLGYSLWLALAAALWLGRKAFRLPEKILAAFALFLIILLTPWPKSEFWLWAFIPGFVRNTTGNWVMNRLYLILAATIATLLVRVLHLRLSSFRRGQVGIAAIVGLALCVWSAMEVEKNHSLSDRGRRSPEKAVTELLPENTMITRFAYLVFPKLPPFFSHGVLDPELEQRFYAEDGKLLWSNTSAILSALATNDPRVHSTPLPAFVPNEQDPKLWSIPGKVKIEAGHHYLLQFHFSNAETAGVLQLFGQRIRREYALPQYGEPESFGIAPEAEKTLPLWSTEASGDAVDIRFVVEDPETASAQASMRIDLIDYDRTILPAKVINWMPLQVDVSTNQGGWLETPRAYQPYWRADNGQTQAARSPNSLVWIHHEAGQRTHTIYYDVPLGFRVLFWLALATAGAAGVYMVGSRRSEAILS